ncbi:zinc-ribbon domain-containing protein [Candidatus Pelagibacter sp.]|nr:zinc-ribbon domain-containing protein [Candidatus Pelagibacter sp.]
MIIVCNNCNKNFEIDSNLIPDEGRLLQCNSCKHKWFFKKETINKPFLTVKINKAIQEGESFNKNLEPTSSESNKDNESFKLLDSVINDNVAIEKILIEGKTDKKINKKEEENLKIEKSENKKNYNILSLTIIFIISFVALIVILDTFQKPISNIIPNIEFLLYNLYETINDIVLFFNDLI